VIFESGTDGSLCAARSCARVQTLAIDVLTRQSPVAATCFDVTKLVVAAAT
jgi:hypothetical protein